MFLPAKTIDDVIERLDEIIDWARGSESRLGYFPLLYREVTIAVKEGIHLGKFEDGARMEKLDVNFANRYLEAWHLHRLNKRPTQAWKIAFNAGEKRRLTVLQHLLLGINAHINLDLGIATAQTKEDAELSALKADFEMINQLLFELGEKIQQRLNETSVLLKWVDKAARKWDEKLTQFSLEKARDNAWRVAEEFCLCMDDDAQAALIEKEDQKTSFFAELVKGPGLLARLLILLVQFSEKTKKPSEIMSYMA